MRYFNQYKKLIDSGKIPACKELKLALKRVEYLKSKYDFYQHEADKRINFIEHECSNTKGLNTLLKLSLPQKVWLEVAWGFYYEKEIERTDPATMQTYTAKERRRLIHQVPIVVSRGTGKTTLGSAIANVGQIIDGEHGADVQMLAYTREQANYLYDASRTMNNYEGSILYLLKQADQLRSTKQGMLYVPTNSRMQIKTSDYEALDGTNAHYTIFDEVHTYDDDFIKVVNDGSSRKRKNWITWYLTTNGTKRDKVFDKYYNQWLRILKGEMINDSIMPWIYKLDDLKEINKPELWQKAVPNLGITTEIDAIKQDIEDAKNDPIAQAEIAAKTFNIPMNNFYAYFTNEECGGHAENFKPELFKGTNEKNSYCILGLDLSDVKDICSCSFMFPQGDKRYFISKKYIPRATFEELPSNVKDQYQIWEKDGYINIHDLEYNDQEYIFHDLRAFMLNNKITPLVVGYDKWNSAEIRRLFEDYYGEICLNIPQTVKGLSQPLKIYKQKMKSGNIIFSDPVMRWCHSNVRVRTDANGNVFPNKQKASDKIDVFASNLDAFIAFERKREDFLYYYQN